MVAKLGQPQEGQYLALTSLYRFGATFNVPATAPPQIYHGSNTCPAYYLIVASERGDSREEITMEDFNTNSIKSNDMTEFKVLKDSDASAKFLDDIYGNTGSGGADAKGKVDSAQQKSNNDMPEYKVLLGNDTSAKALDRLHDRKTTDANPKNDKAERKPNNDMPEFKVLLGNDTSAKSLDKLHGRTANHGLPQLEIVGLPAKGASRK